MDLQIFTESAHMKLLFALPLAFLCIVCYAQTNTKAFQPGKIWYDVDNHPINAHGAGILFHHGTYYLFGEIKQGRTWLVPGQSWECYRTDAGGVSCYSSKNLTDWKYEGVALAPDKTNPGHDLHTSRVLERPKVIYNDKTKKFVMWLHIDAQDYGLGRSGVAVSNRPEGPYTYLTCFRPNNQMSKDQTLFKDDNGTAYQIFSSEDNKVMHISRLSDDYLSASGHEIRLLINKSREAPALFKRKGKYYLITSACSGWDPNAALLCVADSIMGKWTELYNPCVGTDAHTSFNTQSTFVLKVQNNPDEFIFLADRWNKTDLQNSRYVWLPLHFVNDTAVIAWKDSWRLNQ